MRLAFYINYLNHHQVALTDAFYNVLGEEFVCVCTKPVDNSELKGGFDYSSRKYCINATDSQVEYDMAISYARSSEICIFGADSMNFAVERSKYNPSGLSFEMGERWFKKGILNFFSPRFLRWLYNYHRYFKKSNFYRLCSSAFAAKDVNLFGAYINKCLKWGYFINVDEFEPALKITDSPLRIMWCSRFLSWKHPELPIKLAARLKRRNCNCLIDMFGSGERLEKTKKLARKLNVEDTVNFCGSKPNNVIRAEMRKHDIFLFTSDRNEGWGVVLNEAMANGCAVVASDEIGSVPYLIEHQVNGMIFKSENLDSLEDSILYLINNPEWRIKMANNAYYTLNQVWSPTHSVSNFFQFVQSLELNISLNIVGPCQYVSNAKSNH